VDVIIKIVYSFVNVAAVTEHSQLFVL